MELVRLNKAISDTGYCSRREADKLIENGKVTINNRKGVLGDKVSASDVILVNGKSIRKDVEPVYIAFNKPKGITCTTEKHIKGNIVDYINHPARIFPIGRLDKDSEGLIFLTNDGNIVNKILRAGNKHEKEYNVTVNKSINDQFLQKMRNGVPILDKVTKKCKVEQIDSNTFNIILTQGLNRQIRRMCEHLKYEVMSLKRTRIMNVSLGNLTAGAWRELTATEMKEINALVKDSVKTEEASKG